VREMTLEHPLELGGIHRHGGGARALQLDRVE
jgi:hypothetical protein